MINLRNIQDTDVYRDSIEIINDNFAKIALAINSMSQGPVGQQGLQGKLGLSGPPSGFGLQGITGERGIVGPVGLTGRAGGGPLTRGFDYPTIYDFSWIIQESGSGGRVTTDTVRTYDIKLYTDNGIGTSLYGTPIIPIVRPYEIVCALDAIVPFNDFTELGLMICDNSGANFIALTFAARGSVSPYSEYYVKYSGSSNPDSESVLIANGVRWFKITDDGTHRNFFVSVNGNDWAVIATTNTSDYLPNPVFAGIYLNRFSIGPGPLVMILQSFSINPS